MNTLVAGISLLNSQREVRDMETLLPSTTTTTTTTTTALVVFRNSKNHLYRRRTVNPNPNPNLIRRNRNKLLNGAVVRVQVTDEVLAGAVDPIQAEVTWEIVVGALAGVTPFVVAGIEFSKRIVAQKKCAVCKGSGLVRREKYYFRCPRCGGFLPWQSWKRFFTG